MAKIGIEIKNINHLVSAFRQAPKTITEELSKALDRAGNNISSQVKNVIRSGVDMWKPPIRTGAMRRGIQVGSRSPLRITIVPSSATPYAEYVHQGTWKMRARPFFDITAKHKRKEIESFFNKAVDKALQRTVKRTI